MRNDQFCPVNLCLYSVFLHATCNERFSVSYVFAAVNFHSLRLCTLNSTFVLLQTFKQHEIDQVLTSLNMTKSVIVVSIRQYILVRKRRAFTDLTTIMYLIWSNACSGPSPHELHERADLLPRNCSAFFLFSLKCVLWFFFVQPQHFLHSNFEDWGRRDTEGPNCQRVSKTSVWAHKRVFDVFSDS